MIDPDPQINEFLLGSLQDLVLVTTSDGVLRWVSPSCYTILGYRQEEMIGHSAKDFLYAPDLDATRAEMKSSRRGNITTFFECQYVQKDGCPVMLQWSGIWRDEVKLHVFVGRDMTGQQTLTELKEIRRTLNGLVALASPYRNIRHIEIGLSLYSLWAAFVLLHPPSNFAAFPESFWLAKKMADHEQFWGLFAISAAGTKIVGIMLTKLNHYRPGALFRVIGLSMSGVFWTIMGISAVWGNLDTMFGGSGLIFGPLALWFALRVSK